MLFEELQMQSKAVEFSVVVLGFTSDCNLDLYVMIHELPESSGTSLGRHENGFSDVIKHLEQKLSICTSLSS